MQELGRMTDKEYMALWDKEQSLKKRLPHKYLGRMTEEEYKRLWNGNPPKERKKEHEVD